MITNKEYKLNSHNILSFKFIYSSKIMKRGKIHMFHVWFKRYESYPGSSKFRQSQTDAGLLDVPK